jgi:hypothetical protein
VLPGKYSVVSIGKAFESTFQHPAWKQFVTGKGVTVVQFNGTVQVGQLYRSPNFYAFAIQLHYETPEMRSSCAQAWPKPKERIVDGVVYDSNDWLSKMEASDAGEAACIRSKLSEVEAPVTFQFSPSADGKSIFLEFIDEGLRSVVEPEHAKEANVLAFIYN